MRRKSLDSTIR